MRRAVVVLLLIAVVSGLVFNAFTLLVPKLMQERLGEAALPLVGAAAFAATLCGAVAQFTVGRLIDRTTLKRVFLPITLVLVPGLAALAAVRGWPVVPVAGLVSAAIFGQVTLNETMTARYISPALRARMYSVRFFVGFLGSAAAPPVVGFLHERTGSLAAATLVLAGFSVVTLCCAVFFRTGRRSCGRSCGRCRGLRLSRRSGPARSRLPQRRAQRPGAERFRQPDRAVLLAGIAGRDNDGNARHLLADLTRKLASIRVGQADVGDEHLDVGVERRERVPGPLRLAHRVAHLGEQVGGDEAHQLVVLDEEEFRAGHDVHTGSLSLERKASCAAIWAAVGSMSRTRRGPDSA